jgi:hypothetical protein
MAFCGLPYAVAVYVHVFISCAVPPSVQFKPRRELVRLFQFYLEGSFIVYRNRLVPVKKLFLF